MINTPRCLKTFLLQRAPETAPDRSPPPSVIHGLPYVFRPPDSAGAARPLCFAILVPAFRDTTLFGTDAIAHFDLQIPLSRVFRH